MVVGLEQFVAHLLDRPFRIEVRRFYSFGDAIHKKGILKDKQMSVDQERRLRAASPLQLRLRSTQLSPRLPDGIAEPLHLRGDLVGTNLVIKGNEQRIKRPNGASN